MRLARLTPFSWEFLDKYSGPSIGDTLYNKYLKKGIYHYCGEYDVVFLFIAKGVIVDHMLFDRRKEKFRICRNPLPKRTEQYDEMHKHPERFRQDMVPDEAYFYVVPIVEKGRTIYSLQPVN